MNATTLKMRVIFAGLSELIASDGSVAYEIEKGRTSGKYSVTKYLGENVKTRATGTYVYPTEPLKDGAIKAIEKDCGLKVEAKIIPAKRRTSAQKRRDNFVQYD